MDYDLTDYSFYLEAERDEMLRQAVEEAAAIDHPAAVESLLLEMEVMQMLEII